jgi:CRP-like cAMP-binding protein
MTSEQASWMPGNRLLAGLPKDVHQRLLPHLQKVPLELRQVIYEERSAIDHLYFPMRGTLSAVAVMENGNAIEVATVGNEGAVGIGVLVDAAVSLNRVFVQLDGEAIRISASVIRDEAREDGPLRRMLLTYLAVFFGQVTQSVACNGLHPVMQRCCRWLLMTHDRTGGDELVLTHEFLAIMLGVRRSGVTEVLLNLKKRGFIRHSRGRIAILDRQGLEAASCECYRTVRNEYDHLFSGGIPKSPVAM